MGRKTSFNQGLTEVSTVAKEKLGTIRDEGEKVYKYVQYNSGSGSVAGTALRMCYYLNNATDHIVTCDRSDTDGVTAGQIQATLASGSFGWIQIEGMSQSLAVNVTAGAVGNSLTGVGAGDGTVTVSAAVTDSICGILTDATAAANKVLLQCPR